MLPASSLTASTTGKPGRECDSSLSQWIRRWLGCQAGEPRQLLRSLQDIARSYKPGPAWTHGNMVQGIWHKPNRLCTSSIQVTLGTRSTVSPHRAEKKTNQVRDNRNSVGTSWGSAGKDIARLHRPVLRAPAVSDTPSVRGTVRPGWENPK